MKFKALITVVMLMVAPSSLTVTASPAAITEAVTVAPEAHGGAGRIVLVSGERENTFRIYSITGQAVKTVRLAAGQHTSVEVPKGFYVVKCDGQWSRKVVVK